MEQNVQIFENEQFGKLRGVLIDGTPWFVGKDVCTSLGDTNHRRSISRVDDDDKMMISNYEYAKLLHVYMNQDILIDAVNQLRKS